MTVCFLTSSLEYLLTHTARSSCPGLNSLANHGFLPHDGRGINAVNLVTACYLGFGVSPETCAVITLNGLETSKNSLDLVFDLEDIEGASWGIEHDSTTAVFHAKMLQMTISLNSIHVPGMLRSMCCVALETR